MTGTVQDRVVILPKGVQLEDGLHVGIRIHEPGPESQEELFKKPLVEVGLLGQIRKPSWPSPDQDRTPIQPKTSITR
jgi:hypothetical protein